MFNHQPFRQQEGQEVSVEQVTRVSQIIVGALLMGTLTYLGFVLLNYDWDVKPNEKPIISYIAIGMTVMALITRMVVPLIIVNTWRSNLSDSELSETAMQTELLRLFQTKTIIEVAIPEGAAFVAIFALMSEHCLWVLLPLVLLIGAMVLSFPTKTKIENWLKAQKEEMTLESN